jgi:hypothetical protein
MTQSQQNKFASFIATLLKLEVVEPKDGWRIWRDIIIADPV